MKKNDNNPKVTSRIPLLLDRSRPETLKLQIVEQIGKSVTDGRIAGGVRLPSSRRLAEQLQVSRNTVVRAYETLEDEGFIETRPASGVYAVARHERRANPPAMSDPAISGVTLRAMPVPTPVRAPRSIGVSSSRSACDFIPGRPDRSLFPVKAWRRLVQNALSGGFTAGVTQPPDPTGLLSLRSAIANHLAIWRSLPVDPAQVIITTGTQESLSLLAQVLLKPGSAVVIEDPCYRSAALAFAAAEARLISIPADEDGLMTDRLPLSPTALAYVTPSHQFPTGCVMSLERRKHLMRWARDQSCYIVEDDYDSDFQYEGSPLPAIAAAAPDCTVYLGTFSKSLGPGLRVGYLVAPPSLVDAIAAAKTLLNGGNGWLDQAVLAEFIRSGSFVSHLLRTRVQYRERRDVLIEALRRHFGDVEISGAESGMHLFWQLPQGVPAAARLETLALKARVGLYPLPSANVFEEGNGTQLGQRAIVLGYTALSPGQIETGIAKLSDLIDDTLDSSPAFLTELLVHEPFIQARRNQPVSKNRQRPALRAAPLHRTSSATDHFAEKTMQIVRGIYRYPIKGLSGQAISGIELEAGKPFPFDRVFALARPRVPIDEHDPKWAKKGLFVMLMLDEALAKVRTELDPDTLVFNAWSEHKRAICADLRGVAGRADVETFVHELLPALGGKPKLVQSRAGHFMDKPDNVISLINLATVRSLEAQFGRRLDPLRFRANFYIDGLKPWQEFEWIGSDIRLGDATFRVDRRNGRCGATNVNPVNGERDMDIPGSLRAAFGHKDLGVYLITKKSGKVVVGDPLAVPVTSPSLSIGAAEPVVPTGDRHRFICRGCYYIFDEDRGHAPDGIPPGTTFADVSAAWRCPDCGTDKAAFRPYVPA